MELDLADAARASDGALESVDVVGRFVVLEVLAVPALVDAFVDGPQVDEGDAAVVGTLEDEVALEGRLVDESVDEELDFVEDADVVILVLDLGVAVGACSVNHVGQVGCVNELGELDIGGSSGPSACVDDTFCDDLVVFGRVRSR